MKHAIDDAGNLIRADENAPARALCPSCKGVVTLRARRRSNQPGDVTYFWRHDNHSNVNCFARYEAVKSIPRKSKL